MFFEFEDIQQKRRVEMARRGEEKLNWANEHMKVLKVVTEKYLVKRPLKGFKVAMALHPEAKTCVLAAHIAEAGASVRLTACNPYSTDDEVALALKVRGINGLKIKARRGESDDEYYNALSWALDFSPDLILDDGGDLTAMVHERREDFPNLIGISEETTTGIHRAKALEREGKLRVPVMDVNGAMMKRLFDNRYGTGQSRIEGLLRTTNLLIAGKRIIVAGYGFCSRGIAMRLRGLGASVAVTEIDPIKASEAHLDGFDVGRMDELLPQADMVISATGMRDIVNEKHIPYLKEGVILGNSGHFNVEIDLKGLERASKSIKEVRENIKEYRLKDGRKVYVLAEGRLLNLVGGQGHPVEIMDLSFSLQVLSLLYLFHKGKDLPKRVLTIPKDIDDEVAWAYLKANNIRIDDLTSRQESYLKEWH